MEQTGRGEFRPMPPRMEQWDKFNFQVPVHPIVKRFKMVHRWRVIALLSLAMSYENIGVINQYDDEIADFLDMSLVDWMKIQPLMILHHVLREVELPNGKRVYECNPTLLVKQNNDQRSAECFEAATWQLPGIPKQTFSGAPEAKDIEFLIPQHLPQEERENARGAARTAFSRACAKCRQNGQQEPDRDGFIMEYLARRFRQSPPETPLDAPSEPIESAENGNAFSPDFVTLSGNGNAPPPPDKKELREENTNKPSDGNAPQGGDTVTEKRAESVTDGVGGADVCAFFLELGIWEEIVNEHAAHIKSVEQAEMLNDWAQTLAHNPDDYLPLLAELLKNKRRVPKPWARQWRNARAEEAAKIRKALEAQMKVQREAEEAAHLDALYQTLSSEERRAYDQRAEKLLEADSFHHMRWKNNPHSDSAKAEFRKRLHQAMREDGHPKEAMP